MPRMSTNSLSDLDAQIGFRVRGALRDQRWSVNRAAHELGWTQTYLSRRINGVSPFTVSEILRIADFLHLDPTDLLPSRPLTRNMPSDLFSPYQHSAYNVSSVA
jgi:transcriptional regulator with XRE-family HTH domain